MSDEPKFTLAVSDHEIRILKANNKEEFKTYIENFKVESDFAICWKANKKKDAWWFFYMRFEGLAYIIQSQYSRLNGLRSLLLRTDRAITPENYQGISRWAKGVERIGGNLASGPNAFYQVVPMKSVPEEPALRFDLRVVE